MSPEFAICRHPKAPLFDGPDAQLKLRQLISDRSGANPLDYGKETREFLRQACYVQFWFFLKFILGPFGPYERLDTELHLEMANFAQSPAFMRPGAMAAAILFRSSYKSTIFNHGHATWLLYRDPDERILEICNTAGRAHDFKRVVRKNIDSNPLLRWLRPEMVPGPLSERWNEKEIVLPNRSRNYKEPSVQALGIESASAGDHFTTVKWDDPTGLEGLDQAMNVGALMETARKNFRSNRIPLLISPSESKTHYFGTFYAPDDVAMTEIISDAKTIYGYKSDPDIQPVPNGHWDVYYRQILEDGREICPRVMNREQYEELLIRDPWTALTQYANKPRAARQGGFSEARPGSCFLRKDLKSGRWQIVRKGDLNFEERDVAVWLSECRGVMTVDPAGTEDRITSQTSRTSIGIWFVDSRENYYRVWQKVGYISDVVMYDSIFEGNRLFEGHLLGTIFEKVAMQRVMFKQLQREQEKRGVYLGLIPDDVKTDKVARIRHQLGGPLAAGKIWLADGCATEFLEEMYSFPGGSKMDVLDESEKAVRYLQRPMTETEEQEVERAAEQREEATALSAFGY